MSTQATALTTVRPNTMIGLTHTADGRKILMEPKVLKIGIGYPRGKACEAYVNTDAKWIVRWAKKGSDGKLKFETMPPCDTRSEAEAVFRKCWKLADICSYPRKIGYFQFTKPVMGDDGAEIYVPDFDAIEAHSFRADKPGPPTEIDIVFLDDEPYSGGYQMWSASEMKCSGDGENALRVLSLASTPEEKALANEAAAAGRKTFPIIQGCFTKNCRYAKETKDAQGRLVAAACKPGLSIKFQLSRNIRVGGTAFFHTSSFRSIKQVFSSIERIKELTGGRIAGIPLKMSVRSHKTNHNNQPAIHNNVAIEFRAEDMEDLRRNLIEQTWKFRNAMGAGFPADLPQMQMLPARQEPDPEDVFINDNPVPTGIADEFYPDDEDNDAFELEPPPPQAPAAIAAATATQQKQQDIARKLAEAKPRAPWTNKAGMEAILVTVKERVGPEAYESALKRHDIIVGTLAHDDPRAMLFYQDLKSLKGDDESF